MRSARRSVVLSGIVALLLAASAARAAEYPAPKEGNWVVRDFRFHTGEVLPELRMHYVTVGDPSGIPVLILHGSTGSSGTLLTEAFAGQLFGAGQPLDAQKYFSILPDAIGAGKSSKPSDGLRTKFPKYTYEDIVRGHYRLVTEHLGIRRLRLVLGNSAGGMQAWLWAGMYPDFMDAVMPMAASPMAMSGRNWMTRRMVLDMIRNDPEYNNGNYTRQPRSLQLARVYFALATSGGTRALYAAAPTREQADKYIDTRLAQPLEDDANDVIYQYEAARDYDPSPHLERIQAALMAVNAEDDERSPVELGVLEREVKRVKRGRFAIIPASAQTRGHATTQDAKWWARHLVELLQGLAPGSN